MRLILTATLLASVVFVQDKPPVRLAPASSTSLLALAQGPPVDPAASRRADLVELVKLDPTIRLDIRYAGTNNFLGKPVYKEARAFLQRPAAEAVVRAHRALASHGYGLLIHDGYRPWAITKLFWDMTSGKQREFVADPKSSGLCLPRWNSAASNSGAAPASSSCSARSLRMHHPSRR